VEILSWNIQAARGVDNLVSTSRIADQIQKFANPQVICLQEVLRTPEQDQFAELSREFPDFECISGAAINRLYPSGRLEFGNMLLSRLPILQVTQHKLPQPAEPQHKHMPRQAIEVILVNNNELLRVTTTHLDYFAAKQRSAQVKYLAEHHRECTARNHSPSPKGGEEQFASLAETANSIYCGDFNLTVDSDDYQTITGTFGGSDPGSDNGPEKEPDNEPEIGPDNEPEIGKHALVDCWRHVHGDKPHDPTCGIFDRVQWQEGPHCRDFFFVSADVAENVSSMSVETKTTASDHQPLKITIDAL